MAPESDDARLEQRRRLGRSYQGALEAVMAVAVAAGAGAWADASLGTGPWLLLAGIVLGFAAFVMRLVRLGRQMGAPGGTGEQEDRKP